MTTPHDPGASPEDEGIPDLQDGTPEQQRSSDPQRMPVPGDTPTAVTEERPTAEELREGRPLDERLDEEEPEADPARLAGPTRPARDEPEPDEPAPGAEAGDEEPAGLLYDEPDPDRPRNQDVYAQEGTTDGLSAEEEAVRIKDDDEAL
ncbi:DUF5709 domain-containing protein [Streptomyces mobaraensis]|uniref:DUF5709 domain-containing protein n=1 Tax=Streptomyces mobaraensis TaxID=35621 RepID=A0A5N5W9J3_STRMB|nr:DUF5709 domain-containing protein [Streptomyces mobaraensis]KAB7846870.1 hypothetical protein FRZ00_11690 [Streptomyces mobaraensis]